MRGLVAALVVLLLVALGGVVALALRDGETEVEAARGTTVVVTETAQETVTEVETEPQPGAQDLLPAAVAETRATILAAAEAGNHDALAELAPDDFSYTFGGPEGGPAEYWRQLEAQGERPLDVLVAILGLPYALSGGIYVWPFAHATPPEQLTEYELGLLAELPGGAETGPEGYLGWRAGIAPDGAWRFFIAGD